MHKLYKIRAIIIFSALAVCTSAGNLKAQNRSSVPEKRMEPDSIKTSENVPNRFFNDAKNKSDAAISTVRSGQLYKTPSASITNSLSGILSGLYVKQGSGEPGFEEADLNIRGIGSYGFTNGTGYNTATIFVDGFEVRPGYFNFLSASEIESISVFKDASALATFGMKGANGVIWVVTKRGSVGKSTITFQARTGLQSPIQVNKPLNSYNYARLYNQAVSNDNGNTWNPFYSETQLNNYQNGVGTNVDWFNETTRDHAPYADADLRFSGGDTKTKYNIIFDYGKKTGLYDVGNTDSTSNENFGRYNLRANLDFDIGDIFEAQVDLNGRMENRKSPNYTSNYSTANLWTNLYRYPSNIYPVYDGESNNYSGTGIYPNNPVGSINALGWQSNRTRYLQGNFGLKEKLDLITKGLYLKEAFSFNSYNLSSYNKTKTYARYINGVKTTTDLDGNLTNSRLDALSQQDWRQATVTAGYENKFGFSEINSAINFFNSDYSGNGLFGYKIHYQNLSGRLNYSYKSRYVAEFGFSYFGSDAYAPGNRWKFYPAVSAAWIISNEDFLSENDVLSFLKLRGSVGKSATTQAISPSTYGSDGRYLYQQYYSQSGGFYTGTGTYANRGGLNPTFIANPNYGPEESMKYNVGLDLSLFKSLTLNLDAYIDKRSKILTVDNTIPASFGNNIFLSNIGKMTNKGLELSALYNGKSGNVGYHINAIASYNKNKIDYSAELAPAYPYNAITGNSFGTPIGLVADGFYQVEDFNADGSLKSGLPVPVFGNIQAGDIKYKDLDGNHIIDATDVKKIGKSTFPNLFYSFGGGIDFKGFDFSVLLQGVGGNAINILGDNNLQAQNIAFVNNGNAFPIAEGAWAYYPNEGIDNRNTATYPRLTTMANNNNYRTSSFWLKDADYLRVKNVELGYDFNKQTLSKLKLQNLRVFVNAVNPITWSKLLSDYKIDPEFNSGYPSIKSFNVGLIATY